MIKLNLVLDEEEFNLEMPEKWEEVNVEQFCQIMEIQERVKDLTKISSAVELISAITKIPKNIIWLMTPEDFAKLTNALAFVNTEIEAPLKKSIMIDDEEYFVKSNFEELTMGEIITIEQLVEQTNNNLFKTMDKLLTIFLRKKKASGKLESFDINFIADRSEKFRMISVVDIYQLFFSFSDGKILSPNNMKESSEETK